MTLLSAKPTGSGLRPRASAARAQAQAPTRDDLAAAVVKWTVLLLPVNWICGTTPFWCYVAALILALRGRTLAAIEGLFVWLVGALVLGLVVGVARGAPLDRAVASVYNMTILFVMITFMNAAGPLFEAGAEARRRAILRSALGVFALTAVLIVAVFALTKATGQYDISIRTLLLGHGVPLPGVLREYGQVDLSVTDWTVGGPETRVVGFGLYATEGALLFLLFGLLGAIPVFAEKRYWRVAAIEVMITVGLVIMASRTTLGAYLLSLVLLLAMQRRRVAALVLVLAPLVLLGVAVVALYGSDAIAQWFAARNEARLGSSGTRFLSYATGFAMVMAQNPLTGLGIKPVDTSLLLIPIGSHSTVSSMFVKGGLVAITVLAAIYLVLGTGIVRGQAMLWGASGERLPAALRFELVQLSRCVFVTLVWWTTEDLDAPAYEAAIAGLCLGLFWACLRHSARSLTIGNKIPPIMGRCRTISVPG